MPEAECQSCGHEWTLTKPPSEYSRGWPSCPADGCGSTKVTVDGRDKSDVPDTTDQPQGDGQQAQQQVQTQEQASQMQAGGEQVAQSLAPALDQNAPTEQRAESAMQLTQVAGGLLSGFMKYNERKRQRAEQNAKSADLQPVTDKPQCQTEGCSYTFSHIPEGDERIQCPDCGAEYLVN